MSTDYKQLDPECTFDELKEWSVGFAEWIGNNSLVGHSKASVLITLCVILESIIDNTTNETKNHITKVAFSDAVSDEDRSRLALVMQGMMTDDPSDEQMIAKPSKEELLNINPALGHIFGLLSMVDLSSQVSASLSALKMLVASTMLTDSNKADALGEIGHCMGLDELDSEMRRSIHNHLKGGTTEPLPEATEQDIDDACDNLFG